MVMKRRCRRTDCTVSERSHTEAQSSAQSNHREKVYECILSELSRSKDENCRTERRDGVSAREGQFADYCTSGKRIAALAM